MEPKRKMEPQQLTSHLYTIRAKETPFMHSEYTSLNVRALFIHGMPIPTALSSDGNSSTIATAWSNCLQTCLKVFPLSEMKPFVLFYLQ